MPGILDALGTPFGSVLTAVGDILGRFIASPDEKLKAQLELAKVGADFQVKMAEADAEFAKSQAAVITSEVQSQSWAARNWRPVLMLTFTYIIAHNFVIAPTFHLSALAIPPEMWTLLNIGIGGYIVGRSAEKIVPGVLAMKGSGT